MSYDGNFPRSPAGEYRQSSSVASDDDALIDLSEDEAGAGRWFDGLQVATRFIHLSNFLRFSADRLLSS